VCDTAGHVDVGALAAHAQAPSYRCYYPGPFPDKSFDAQKVVQVDSTQDRLHLWYT
jgi:hypothetical protein